MLQCLPSSFSSIQLTIWEMLFEDFDMGAIQGYWNQVWAQSDLGFGSRYGFKIFKMAVQMAILDTQTEQFKQFWISVSLWCFPSGFGSILLMVWEEVVWRISRWLPWWPSWVSERNNFSNSESLWCSDASHQVLAQSDLRFGRRYRLKNFKMAVMVTILDIGTEWF